MKRARFSHSTAYRVLALISALALIFASIPAFSQSVMPTGAALGAVGQIQTSSEFASDVLLGKNTKGPYFLGWKQIESESETVTIDGVTAQRGSDYKIDYDSGTMSFDKPLRAQSVAQVQYRCKDGKSVRNTAGLSLPIELNLLQRSSSSVSFTGLYKEENPLKQDSGVSVLGLAGNHKWGASSDLTGQFLVSSQQDGDTGNLADRSAFKLGGSRNTGRLQIKTGYQRSGENFAGNKEYGLTGGNAIIDVGVAYAASARLHFSNTYNQVQNLTGAAKGSTTTVGEQKVAFAAGGNAVTLSRNTNDVNAATGATQAQETNKIEASHVVGKTTTNVSVATTTVNDSVTSTESRQTMTAFQMQAAGKVQLQASQTQSDSNKLGSADATKVAVTANPISSVKIAANYNSSSSDLAGNMTSTGVDIAANPVKNISFHLNATTSDSTALGLQANRGFSLQANPNAKLGVTAGITQQVNSTVSDVTRVASVQLQPQTWFKLGGGISTREVGNDVSTITDINALLKPVDFLSISGSYKNRQMADPNASLDTMKMDLSVNTAKYLKLTAGIQRNPEDPSTGQVTALDNAALDAETHIGNISFTSGYARRMDRTLGSLSAEHRYSIGLPVFGHGLFTGGYKLSDPCAAYLYRTETFSLGYTHKVGDLDLSLGGTMTRANQEQMQLDQKPDVEAQVKAGLKF